jgi:hypothetical protein
LYIRLCWMFMHCPRIQQLSRQLMDLMPDRPPSVSILYFLRRASPWPVLQILAFSPFTMTIACSLHDSVTKSCKYGILNAKCKSRVGVRLGRLPMVRRTLSPWYPLDKRLGGPQSRSGRGGEKKNSQPPPGIEP